MTKTLKTSSKKRATKAPSTVKVVWDEKTGKSIIVKGYGALKDSDLRIKKGVSLTKPIAQQVLNPRAKKRKTG